jgi:hypothetical protein
MLSCLEVEFLILSASCVAISTICSVLFSNMCSVHSGNNSRKLRLRCGCQFSWCALAHIVRVAPRLVIKHHAMRKWSYSSTIIDPGTLDGGEWSASRPCRSTLGESALGTHWLGGWVGTTAGLEHCGTKPFVSAGDRTPTIQPVVRLYIDWTIPALVTYTVHLKFIG